MTTEASDQFVSVDCIGEPYLRKKLQENAEERTDAGGDDETFVCSVEAIADEVESAFERHYQRTSGEPNSYEFAMLRDRESNYEWYRKGQQTTYAIMDAADISEELAEQIQQILEERHSDRDSAAIGEECEFDSEAHYEEIMPDDYSWRYGWDAFENTIKTESRFFSQTAERQLKELFAVIDGMRTQDGEKIVVDAGPGTPISHLYRARVFQNPDDLLKAMERPDEQLAPPPTKLASSGRMNAQGISVFYGATNDDIALAEVRPPVGSQVAVARFEVIRNLRLLNLPALSQLKETGSIFDPAFAFRLGRMRFLRSLINRISRAVMPNDEAAEYLPTQAIADFLATKNDTLLDGIIFPSVQSGEPGVNVGLFHKAAKVKFFDIPRGTEITARTFDQDEDGPYPDYSVYVETPPPIETEKSKPEVRDASSLFEFEWDDLPEQNDDRREITLKLPEDALWVHRVESVKINSEKHKVQRRRRIKPDPEF